MTTVTVSDDYRIELPPELSQRLALRPGERFQVLSIGNRIELVPLRSAREMRGFLRGIDTAVPREGEPL